MRSADGAGVVYDLSGVNVLITGAGGGLGHSLVDGFLRAGASVVAHHRSPSTTLRDLAARHPALRAIAGDLREAETVEQITASGYDGSSFDVLVNNAGSYPVTPILHSPPETFSQVVEANTLTAYHCLHHAARHMREAGGGSIVNIASLAASRTSGQQAAYDSAKAAVVRLTRSAAAELAPHNIRVNAVSPGLLQRPGIESDWPEGVRSWQQRCPLQRLGTHEEVAHVCLFLAAGASSWITGQEVVVDGGMSVAPSY
jgi:NAD(P)-dependent dehydrogenase (short-subunit alcohol dehydrogenase family)